MGLLRDYWREAKRRQYQRESELAKRYNLEKMDGETFREFLKRNRKRKSF